MAQWARPAIRALRLWGPSGELAWARRLRVSGKGGDSTKEKLLLQDVAELIRARACQRVVVMVGAGISTPSGIPDFRSPGTGFYSSFQHCDVPYPEAIFELTFFLHNPRPFCTWAKKMDPRRYRPNVIHYFLRLLQDKGLLLRLYTQNIDGLERAAGIPDSRLVEAHGSFASATCTVCRRASPAEGFWWESRCAASPQAVGGPETKGYRCGAARSLHVAGHTAQRGKDLSFGLCLSRFAPSSASSRVSPGRGDGGQGPPLRSLHRRREARHRVLRGGAAPEVPAARGGFPHRGPAAHPGHLPAGGAFCQPVRGRAELGAPCVHEPGGGGVHGLAPSQQGCAAAGGAGGQRGQAGGAAGLDGGAEGPGPAGDGAAQRPGQIGHGCPLPALGAWSHPRLRADLVPEGQLGQVYKRADPEPGPRGRAWPAGAVPALCPALPVGGTAHPPALQVPLRWPRLYCRGFLPTRAEPPAHAGRTTRVQASACRAAPLSVRGLAQAERAQPPP